VSSLFARDEGGSFRCARQNRVGTLSSEVGTECAPVVFWKVNVRSGAHDDLSDDKKDCSSSRSSFLKSCGLTTFEVDHKPSRCATQT
jgi:hypothetical protein